MSKRILDLVKPGVLSGDDVSLVYKTAKMIGFAMSMLSEQTL